MDTQRLEAIRARVEAVKEQMRIGLGEGAKDAMKDYMEHTLSDTQYLLDQIAALTASLEQERARADAAEHDVQLEADETCAACKHHGCEESCQARVQYAVAYDESCFQWRGVCPANTKGGPANES